MAERSAQKCREYIARIGKYQPEQLVFVDESSFAWQAESVVVAVYGGTDGWVGEDEKRRDKNT